MQSVFRFRTTLAAVAALLLPLTASACAGSVPAAEAPALSVGAVPETAPEAVPEEPSGPLTGRDAQLLSAALDEYAAGMGAEVSAAVYDSSTGGTWYYNRDGRYLEASLVKVPILLTLLRQATEEGRSLTEDEEYLAALMIEYSDNPSTTALYESVGGPEELSRTYELLGVSGTEATQTWGTNDTGVEDQLKIARAVAEGVDWIDEDLHSFAVGLMENVDAGQRWGISAGVGDTGAEIALKNGWLPDDTLAWNVGSTGFVRSDAAEYSIVVLTSGALTMDDGVSVVEEAARMINSFQSPATDGTGPARDRVWRADGPDA